jgi:hypothetical protein
MNQHLSRITSGRETNNRPNCQGAINPVQAVSCTHTHARNNPSLRHLHQYLTSPHHTTSPKPHKQSRSYKYPKKTLTQPNSQTGLGLHPTPPAGCPTATAQPEPTHTPRMERMEAGLGGLDAMRCDPAEQARTADPFLARSRQRLSVCAGPGLSVITVAAGLTHTQLLCGIALHVMPCQIMIHGPTLVSLSAERREVWSLPRLPRVCLIARPPST